MSSEGHGDGPGPVTFLQLWTMPDMESVEGWLDTMHRRIHLLTGLPGFRSMSLYGGVDHPHAAVRAEWDSVEALLGGRNDAPVREAHAELAAWGQEVGRPYRLDRTYGPSSG